MVCSWHFHFSFVGLIDQMWLIRCEQKWRYILWSLLMKTMRNECVCVPHVLLRMAAHINHHCCYLLLFFGGVWSWDSWHHTISEEAVDDFSSHRWGASCCRRIKCLLINMLGLHQASLRSFHVSRWGHRGQRHTAGPKINVYYYIIDASLARLLMGLCTQIFLFISFPVSAECFKGTVYF